jgi:PTS system mannitol-specific IIC component
MTSTSIDLPGPPNSAASGARARVQAFGGFLTAMVIPNVGAFIAWGLITALFIPTGWLPNEDFAQLVDPMITYLLPLLLAFTGGRLVHGQRGGVIGALGAVGVIVGADIPMFLGAMIMGPLSAWLLKKLDRLLEGRVRAGFEMLVNTFSLGLLGLALCLTAFRGVGPLISQINEWMLSAISALVETGFLPLLSVLNEPAKVLFLNNVIDQGMYYPLGMQETADAGQSIFFMVASNPGPGLGLLAAFFAFSRSRAIRNSTPGAMVIHFLGGIHEIYFPYVLMKPVTILAMIAGGASGIVTFTLFDVGLVAGPSPGSIVSYLLLTPRGNFLGVIAGVVIAAAVSFLVTALILKIEQRRGNQSDDAEQELAEAQARSSSMKAEGKAVLAAALEDRPDRARSIVFSCDAGMGSSAMGASVFRDRLAKAAVTGVDVGHSAIENVPDHADLVVVHANLADRLRRARPDAEIVTISNYLSDPALDELLAALTTPTEEPSRAI